MFAIRYLIMSLILLFVFCANANDLPILQRMCINYFKYNDYIHVVKTDLHCSGLKLVGRAYSDIKITTSAFAKQYDVDVAINGDIFGVLGLPLGLNVSDGAKWKGSADKSNRSFIACTKNKACVIDQLDNVSELDPNWDVVIGGHQVYSNGTFNCARSAKSSCYNSYVKMHPRTSIGLDQFSRFLYFIVVEGRLKDFQGITLHDLSSVFRDLGIATGLNLDGGGSSTLVIDGKRINKLPYDQKTERPVGNHLGLIIK